MGRREFLRRLGATTAGAAGLTGILSPFEFAKDAMAAEPSIKITSIDYNGKIIRINTNKGICGYGEIRDTDSQGSQQITNSTFWQTLKGMNPTQVSKVFDAISNIGSPHNQSNQRAIPRLQVGGGCAVEMACWDILGKVHNLPVWKLMGPKYRDGMRMYCDTGSVTSSAITTRINLGFKWFKMDNQFGGGDYTTNSGSSYSHPYTYAHVTNWSTVENRASTYRTALNNAGLTNAPLSSDHNLGYAANTCLDVESAVEYARRMKAATFQGSSGGWLEDTISWWWNLKFSTSNTYETIHSLNTNGIPLLTGEDCYGFVEFKSLIDSGCIDIIHPDPASSGGINECRMAAVYAASKGVKTALHCSDSAFSAVAFTHIVAGIPEPYFCACECHAADSFSSWQNGVAGVEKPLMRVSDGCIPLPQGPGLGVRPSVTSWSSLVS